MKGPMRRRPTGRQKNSGNYEMKDEGEAKELRPSCPSKGNVAVRILRE